MLGARRKKVSQNIRGPAVIILVVYQYYLKRLGFKAPQEVLANQFVSEAKCDLSPNAIPFGLSWRALQNEKLS